MVERKGPAWSALKSKHEWMPYFSLNWTAQKVTPITNAYAHPDRLLAYLFCIRRTGFRSQGPHINHRYSTNTKATHVLRNFKPIKLNFKCGQQTNPWTYLYGICEGWWTQKRQKCCQMSCIYGGEKKNKLTFSRGKNPLKRGSTNLPGFIYVDKYYLILARIFL